MKRKNDNDLAKKQLRIRKTVSKYKLMVWLPTVRTNNVQAHKTLPRKLKIKCLANISLNKNGVELRCTWTICRSFKICATVVLLTNVHCIFSPTFGLTSKRTKLACDFNFFSEEPITDKGYCKDNKSPESDGMMVTETQI